MIVVADTSVILNLCCVRQAQLLPQLFREVLIPPEVAAEFRRLVVDVPRFSGLTLPSWIREQRCATVPETLQTENLDPGETAALALGLTVIGLVSILLRAKAAGLLPRVAPVLETLRRDAQFWLSQQLCAEILRLAGETV